MIRSFISTFLINEDQQKNGITAEYEIVKNKKTHKDELMVTAALSSAVRVQTVKLTACNKALFIS